MSGPTKITFGDMRDMGVRGLLIYDWRSVKVEDVLIAATPRPFVA